jgi:hypothetical protein
MYSIDISKLHTLPATLLNPDYIGFMLTWVGGLSCVLPAASCVPARPARRLA